MSFHDNSSFLLVLNNISLSGCTQFNYPLINWMTSDSKLCQLEKKRCCKGNSQISTMTSGPFQHWDYISLQFIHLSLLPFLLSSPFFLFIYFFPPSDTQFGGEKAETYSSVSKVGTVISSFFLSPLPSPCLCSEKAEDVSISTGQPHCSDICNMGTMVSVSHVT